MINETCIFCKIIKGEIPSVKIWEDEKHFAFLDANPINPGHILIVPKNHSDYIFDLGDKDYTELMLKSRKLAKTLKEKLKPKRVGMVTEGFGVPHVHVHLIPLNKKDEINQKTKFSSNEELKKIAEKITK